MLSGAQRKLRSLFSWAFPSSRTQSDALSERRFRTMFEKAPLGIALIDSLTGDIIDVNARFAAIAGRSIEKIKTIDWMSITHPDDVQEDLENMRRLNAGEIEGFRMKKRYIQPNGAAVWIDMSIAPLDRDQMGRRRHLCMIEDITEQKQAESSLQKAKLEAEVASEAKSNFLAHISHEIRTPLSVIQGFAELLHDSMCDMNERVKWSTAILHASRQLELLISDILDISKIEAGRIDIELTRDRSSQILEDLGDFFQVSAHRKGISLDFQAASDIPPDIVTDWPRLRQILINLIGNAIKFTEKGGVTVRLRREFQRENQRPLLAFDIDDSGIGIASEQQDRLFQVFSQADGSITRRFGGSGLGLAISRRLALLLGGDVVLQRSELGQGSCFTLTIDPDPLASDRRVPSSPQPLQLTSETDMDLEGLHVLLVEDAPDLRLLIEQVLAFQGIVVETACHGREGIERLQAGSSFDAILMDLQMPVMDGYTATRWLRESGWTLPIFALTAHAMEGDRERCLQAGFSGYLTKPVDFDKMFQLFRSLKQRRPLPQEPHVFTSQQETL